MITRRDVIADAADKCMKELYSLAQPTITWEDFIKENKEFIKREEEYYKLPKENKISYKEFMGPKPYEFYYLPKEVLKEVVDNYIYAYEIDEHQNLLDTIENKSFISFFPSFLIIYIVLPYKIIFIV